MGQIDTLQNVLREGKDNQQNAVKWADLMAQYTDCVDELLMKFAGAKTVKLKIR